MASRASSTSASRSAAERLGTTRDGQVKGKLAYMAPEQTTSEPVDRRVDVFTTAIVLWECLTQRRLFRGQTDAEALRMLLEKPIPHIRESFRPTRRLWTRYARAR